jgi:hypothetical protein
MKRIFVLLAVALFAANAAAQNCQGDIAALRALYEVRQILMHPYGTSYQTGNVIDEALERMREPLPGGGYRWVHFVRPSGDGPVQKREHTVANDFESGKMDEWEATGDHPFAIRIAVPRKRSMFKANKESYVGRVDIRYWVDGKEKTMTKDLNQWFSVDTMKTIDLGAIADRAVVTIEAASRGASAKESLVEVHFKQAIAQDDPDNPSYDAIQSLKRLQTSTDPVTVDYEIAKFEKRLFPELISTPYTSLFTKIREAEKLIKSEKSEDQEKGKKMLAEVTSAIR